MTLPEYNYRAQVILTSLTPIRVCMLLTATCTQTLHLVEQQAPEDKVFRTPQLHLFLILTLASVPMTRSFSSMILSFMDDR